MATTSKTGENDIDGKSKGDEAKRDNEIKKTTVKKTRSKKTSTNKRDNEIENHVDG